MIVGIAQAVWFIITGVWKVTVFLITLPFKILGWCWQVIKSLFSLLADAATMAADIIKTLLSLLGDLCIYIWNSLISFGETLWHFIVWVGTGLQLLGIVVWQNKWPLLGVLAVCLLVLTVWWAAISIYIRLVYGKKVVEYYPQSKNKRRQYYLKRGQKHGQETCYYHSGKINKTQMWYRGKKQGAFTIWYPTGEAYFVGQYNDDKLVEPVKVHYLEPLQPPTLDLTEIDKNYVSQKQQFCSECQQSYQKLTEAEDADKSVIYPKKLFKTVTGIRAYQDRKKAKQLVDVCSSWHKTACQTTRYYQRKMKESISDLGKIRLEVLQGVVGEFLGCLKDMNQKNKINYYELMGKIGITPQVAKEFGDIDMSVSKLSSNTLLVGTLGTFTAVSTPAAVTSAVAAYAAASTSTAISSLSGAAATNATLAWLGGGSIASGGGGMAAGAAVLSTATAAATGAVAIVTAGIIATVHYSNKLTKTTQQAADMAVNIARMEESWVIMNGIIQRANELTIATFEIQQKALAAISRLKPLTPDFDTDVEYYNQTFRTAARLVESLIGLVKVALLDEKGNLNEMGLKEIAQTRKMIKNTELVTYE
ncbi:MAG: toxin-antitoxin system YwqK family antitoxin [Candidatus Avelusimicrobium sp.]|uniref:toxin-antitoxin system YwqK family antitoxin n=1 Tax=Candidatus Avelusimicrobium sp. TaxID=3048833 RepID=UPI003F06F768